MLNLDRILALLNFQASALRKLVGHLMMLLESVLIRFQGCSVGLILVDSESLRKLLSGNLILSFNLRESSSLMRNLNLVFLG